MNERILNKLSEAKDSVDLVEENFPEDYEDFLDMSRLERDGIYKNIEFAIQNVLDICAIVLKDNDLRVPGSDDVMLDELRESGVMDETIIDTIKDMKGLRNLLVHRYGFMDHRIAYEDIKKGLQDFPRIFEEIKNSAL